VHHARLHTGSATDAILKPLQDLSRDISQRFTTILWSLRKHGSLKLWKDVQEIVPQVINLVV